MKQIAILVLAASLYACSPADNDPGPGGVSVGEARALDEAAEMIEAKRLPEQQDEAASDQTHDAAAQDD
ncbi:MAG: hypothetical protein WAT93_08895 [Pontixanthobacter sp.]